MRNFIIIAAVILISGVWCVDAKYLDYQPANPPAGIELLGYNGDYLLVFRSENRSNTRFGGFLVFTDQDAGALTVEVDFDKMSDEEQAAFVSGAAYNLAGSAYNTGMDSPVAVLFSDDESIAAGAVIETGGTSYTLTSRLDDNGIEEGLYLTLRTYLVDLDGEVLTVSTAGDVVMVE